MTWTVRPAPVEETWPSIELPAPTRGAIAVESPLHIIHTSGPDEEAFPIVELDTHEWLVPYTLEVDPLEDGGARFQELVLPPEEHPLGVELSEAGQSWFADDSEFSEGDHTAQALGWGLAPGQLCYLRITLETWGPSYFDSEYEAVWGVELVWKAEFTSRQTANAWEEYIAAVGRQREEDRDHKAAWQARAAKAGAWLELDYNYGYPGAVLRRHTGAVPPCLCHYYTDVVTTVTAPRDAAWVVWLEQQVHERGWGSLPIALRIGEANHYLQTWTAKGFEVDAKNFPYRRCRVVLPSLDTMEGVVREEDAKWRLSTWEDLSDR